MFEEAMALHAASTISVVIPTWCEAEHIQRAVAAAHAVADEVIVVDAGSPDHTAALAERSGARVLVSGTRGRGPQLEAGARAARGDALLFLHADATLPPEARPAILAALADPAVVGGNFRLVFEPPGAAARIFGWANDLRRRWLGIYYGDSALFLRRQVHAELGGFRPLPLFEDYELVRRLERRGRTVYLRELTVRASARRFARAPLRTLALWTVLQLLYSAGVAPSRLARLYGDPR
jgi:rSAM/selenodomain-associated transferase 2